MQPDRRLDVAAGFLDELPFVSGNLLFDEHIAILMGEHGIERVYTRDTDFHKFSSVKVIVPLK